MCGRGAETNTRTCVCVCVCVFQYATRFSGSVVARRDQAMTALGVVRDQRGGLKGATLTEILGLVDDVLNLGLVVSCVFLPFPAKSGLSE